MCLLPSDFHQLRRALDLAREAAAFASPNPTVGCVLTIQEKVIGEGAHSFDTRDHAEIVALKAAAAAGYSTQGATAFVTLEPCSHHGRTGPCADALVTAGVTRCVVATTDPNPVVMGQGIAKLRSAGVAVDLLGAGDALATEARRLNDAFAFSVQQGRPFVTLKSAVSLDGFIAPHPSTRSEVAPSWLTGPAARTDVQHLRHGSDALLTGIGTVLADNPKLSDRSGLSRRRPLLRVLLDSHLHLPLHSALVQSANDDLLIICEDTASADRRASLRRFPLEVVSVPSLKSPGALVDVLHLLEGRQIRSVLLEAGSALNAAFLQANLVDKVVLYFADRELGPGSVSFAAGFGSPYLLQERVSSQTRVTFPHGVTEDVRIAGYLHDPWASL